ncbi:MAG TPA: hypothetical protein VF595_01455 [Tepidisphaeraceae bacterium]|jgi:hypothetical protein
MNPPAVRAAAPATAPAGWRLDLRGHTPHEVYVGVDRAYVVLRVGYRTALPPTPQAIDPTPFPAPSNRSGPGGDAVICVDLNTGMCRWIRHYTGNLRFAVAADDSLWGVGYELFKLDADSGQTTVNKKVNATDVHRIAVLRDGGAILRLPPISSTGPRGMREPDNGPVRALDTATAQVSDQLLPPTRRSPDGGRRLIAKLHQSPQDVTTTFVAEALPTAAAPGAGGTIWEHATRGYAYNGAVWFEQDAILLSGAQDTQANVTRLDGRTGAIKWTTPLPGGAYSAESVYLRDNGHLNYAWDAVGPVGHRLAAINGRGRVTFFDAASGAVVATCAAVDKHLAFPKRVGENVVFFSADGVVAVPADTLLSDDAGRENARAAVQRARLLLAAGQTDAAAAIATAQTEAGRPDAEAWRLAADVALAKKDRPAATLSRVHALEAAGEPTSADLTAEFGLVRYVPTGPVKAELAPWPPFLYAASTDGTLFKLIAATGEPAVVTRVDADIGSLRLRGNTLYRRGEDRHEHEISILVGPRLVLGALDPLRDAQEPLGAPHDWYTTTGYDGRAVEQDGRRYRPLGGGGLRVLDGQTVTTLPPKLPIQSWQLYTGPGGPLGFGEGGVYKVNDAFVPSEKLIDSGMERLNNRPYDAVTMASDGRTIAAVMWRSDKPVLQIWTADGHTKLREEPAPFGRRAFQSSGELIALRDGYLFSGDDLMWTPTNPDRPVWRFALQTTTWPRGMRHQEATDYGFGTPRVMGDRLFVACRDGGVFVFDVAAVTR